MPTDCRGTKIAVGSLVAYNLSGSIAVGRISKITPREPYFKEDPADAKWFYVVRSGHPPSKVSRKHNLLVLKESE